MPCWYDLWTTVKGYAPLALAIFALAMYLFLVGSALWVPIQKRSLRITSRVVGATGLIPIVVGFPLTFFALSLTGGNPPTKVKTVRSLAGDEATVSYNAGFLGRDYTDDVLKRATCCRHVEVMWHAGPSELQDMQMEWPDADSLHLTYHARLGDPQHCEQRVSGVAITCTVLPLQ